MQSPSPCSVMTRDTPSLHRVAGRHPGLCAGARQSASGGRAPAVPSQAPLTPGLGSRWFARSARCRSSARSPPGHCPSVTGRRSVPHHCNRPFRSRGPARPGVGGENAVADDVGPVHLPNRGGGVVVLPQDVGGSITATKSHRRATSPLFRVRPTSWSGLARRRAANLAPVPSRRRGSQSKPQPQIRPSPERFESSRRRWVGMRLEDRPQSRRPAT